MLSSNSCNNCNSLLRIQTLLVLSIIGCSSIISAFQTPISTSTSPFRSTTQTKTTTHLFSTREKPTQTKPKSKTTLVDPSNLHVNGNNNGATSSTTISDDLILLDLSSYENSLLSSWDDPRTQKGFDWEIEKLRRYFAGLRQVEDGTWVRKPSLFDFLVTHTPSNVVGVDSDSDRYEAPPQPVNMVDVVVLVIKNLLNGIGFGPSLGMAAVPDAIIQKYEGSFFSFIKGVLGGDLQTLAGGPLFLLLEKYYNVHGPIFNLSFGPKSFLIISDPVMARHILRDSSPEQYCKGILAEILEPIMGDGLIPADPKIWKVSLIV